MIELRVSDLKQYLYCPRIIYFTYVAPVRRKLTHKMEHGKQEHAELDRLEKRRKLVEYGLDQGERRFHVPLYSERLGLRGELDLLVISPKGHFPVEYKYTSGPAALNHKYQLAAYALLVEESFGVPVRRGFIYLIQGKRLREVEVTPNVREHLRRTLGAIRNLVALERMPALSRSYHRCRDCEYRKYCGDTT